jgi:hypothetical protein
VQHGAHVFRRHEAREAVTRLVLANHGKQRHLRAQRGDVACDVGGPARTLLGAPDVHHRHRRLGRNARHFAKPVAIQHHVADDENAGVLKGCGMKGEG